MRTLHLEFADDPLANMPAIHSVEQLIEPLLSLIVASDERDGKRG